jgi:hypothetical protein
MMATATFPVQHLSIQTNARCIVSFDAFVDTRVDATGTIFEKGAFDASLKHKSEVPILCDNHAEWPVGVAQLSNCDNEAWAFTGMMISGRLNADIEKGREIIKLFSSQR